MRHLVAEKVDNAGRHVRQIELCESHARLLANAGAASRFSTPAIGAETGRGERASEESGRQPERRLEKVGKPNQRPFTY